MTANVLHSFKFVEISVGITLTFSFLTIYWPGICIQPTRKYASLIWVLIRLDNVWSHILF